MENNATPPGSGDLNNILSHRTRKKNRDIIKSGGIVPSPAGLPPLDNPIVSEQSPITSSFQEDIEITQHVEIINEPPVIQQDGVETTTDGSFVITTETPQDTTQPEVLTPLKNAQIQISAETTNIVKDNIPTQSEENDDIVILNNDSSDDTIVIENDVVEKDEEEDLNDIELIDQNSPESEEINELEEKSIQIGKLGTSKIASKITDFNPGSNIKVVNSDEYQSEIIKQYVIGRNNVNSIVGGPRSISKAALAYSGISLDIFSYSNAEMLSIHRGGSESNIIEKIESEMRSAYDHTVSTSLKIKLDFNEWCKVIKYPDIWSIYWSIYNVNHPGINSYDTSCDNVKCDAKISVKRENYDLAWVDETSKDDITEKDISDIRNGNQRKFINSFNVAEKIIEMEEFLPESKFKVFYGMPSLYDLLIFLRFMSTELNESDSIINMVFKPLSWLQFEDSIDKSTLSKVLAYKYNLYTRKLLVPISENIPSDNPAQRKIKLTYVDANPLYIPLLINGLSKADFKAYISLSSVKQLIRKEGIVFQVRNFKCPQCGTKQKNIMLDMRDVIFTRAAVLTDSLINM